MAQMADDGVLRNFLNGVEREDWKKRPISGMEWKYMNSLKACSSTIAKIYRLWNRNGSYSLERKHDIIACLSEIPM